MAYKDNHNSIYPRVALNTQAISTNTTTNGNWIDTATYGSLEFILQSGTITDGTYTPLIQDADESDYSDAAAVADDYLLPAGGGAEAAADFVAADDNTNKRLGYIGGKRYVRLSIVSTGVTTGGTLSAIALLGHPQEAPTDNN